MFVHLSVSFVFFISALCFFYTLTFLYSPSHPCPPLPNPKTLLHDDHRNVSSYGISLLPPKSLPNCKTELRHIAFGIGSSSDLWNHRKNYVRLWWRPAEMRGAVWLDRPLTSAETDDRDLEKDSLPPVKISGDTSGFDYTHEEGRRSGIRISRIVSETLRLGLRDVRWFVMGDDDTYFVADNLVRVLGRYDHNQFYYIGSVSESHRQNIKFSYEMAYGGGGFAISYALAVALEKMQDKCIQRYPELYGSDDRIQACMAELGVPLTREVGFHQVSLSLFLILLSPPSLAPSTSIILKFRIIIINLK